MHACPRIISPFPGSPTVHLPDNARNRLIGIGIVSFAYLCFAVLDGSAKWLVRSLPVFEVVWLRFAGHLLFMAVPVARAGQLSPGAIRRPWLQFARAAMLLSMTGLNFVALQYLQLAETSAVMFSMPILVTVISALFLGERLDAGRWAAVIAGFVGVLLIVRPGTHAFHPAILLSVGNATVYALFSLVTRRIAATDPPALTNLLSAAGATLMIAPFALATWKTPERPLEWVAIVLTGLAGGTGHLCLAHAHRFASAATLAPFLYQQILYMTLVGFLVFGDVPGTEVVGGATIVVACGLYLIWREQRAVASK